MQVYNYHQARKNGAAVLLPLICALAINTSPVQAQQESSAPSHEQHAGKHGQFGYRCESADGQFHLER